MHKMNDEDFWNNSAQVGFDFEDLDNWSVNSEAFRKSGFQGSEVFHSGGIHDSLEKKKSSSKIQVGADVKVSADKELSLYADKATFSAAKNQTTCATPSNTVKNILLGFNINLESHKSMDEKVMLLNHAVKCHDGNAIMAAVLFLRSTLKKSIFQREILHHPEALHHYICYLQMDQEFDELSDIFWMVGNTEDAAILKYKAAIKLKDPNNKVKKLENCLNTHFQLSSMPSLYVDCVTEYISLLRRQLPIEEDDLRQEHEGSNEVFKFYPREHTLVDVSLISTLYYCCIYHYKLGENNLASPVAIKKCHQLTDKQYVWTAISALAQLQNWPEIEALFLNKGWLGNLKMKCCIGFNKAVPILATAGAPSEVILKYIELVDNVNEKLNLAKKYKFHRVVMKMLMSMRDKQEFLLYQSELLPRSAEFNDVDEILHSAAVKWKN